MKFDWEIMNSPPDKERNRKMEIQNDVKKFTSGLSAKFHTYGLWTLIVFLLGIFCGFTYFENRYNKKMTESIQLKGIIYNGEVYDIQKRVTQ